MRSLLVLASLAASLALVTGCAFDEGINVHDLEGTVLVPKSVAPTADDVGMIYVGLYSGVDLHLGYTSPIAAPAASTAGADTFPYGGTSSGSFYSRDVRTVCQSIAGRSVRDGGANWEVDFEILQFPFYEGANVWGWMDTLITDTAGTIVNSYTSCDPNNGYYSYYQIEVDPVSVDSAGSQFEITLEDSDLPDVPGGNSERRYQDADGSLWGVSAIDIATDVLTVGDIYSVGGKPAINGPSQPIILSYEELQYYGSQFQDTLNFPGKYIRVGDFVNDAPVVLDSLSGKVELTIDFEVQ